MELVLEALGASSLMSGFRQDFRELSSIDLAWRVSRGTDVGYDLTAIRGTDSTIFEHLAGAALERSVGARIAVQQLVARIHAFTLRRTLASPGRTLLVLRAFGPDGSVGGCWYEATEWGLALDEVITHHPAPEDEGRLGDWFDSSLHAEPEAASRLHRFAPESLAVHLGQRGTSQIAYLGGVSPEVVTTFLLEAGWPKRIIDALDGDRSSVESVHGIAWESSGVVRPWLSRTSIFGVLRAAEDDGGTPVAG